MNNKINGGFTLIEVVIVVGIVRILNAYSSYMVSAMKGRGAEGRAALAELLQQQERYMTQRNVYLSFTNLSGTTNPAIVPFKPFLETMRRSRHTACGHLCARQMLSFETASWLKPFQWSATRRPARCGC